MMALHPSVPRLLGVLLLALAISPVTAPFSTCRLADLFSGPGPADAILQPHPAAHDPVAGLGSTPDAHPLREARPITLLHRERQAQHRGIVRLQLRI